MEPQFSRQALQCLRLEAFGERLRGLNFVQIHVSRQVDAVCQGIEKILTPNRESALGRLDAGRLAHCHGLQRDRTHHVTRHQALAVRQLRQSRQAGEMRVKRGLSQRETDVCSYQ